MATPAATAAAPGAPTAGPNQHAPFRPRFAAIGPVTRSVGVVVQFGERGTIKTVIHWNETEDELVRISTVAFTACP